jgi:hypothetical protein
MQKRADMTTSDRALPEREDLGSAPLKVAR